MQWRGFQIYVNKGMRILNVKLILRKGVFSVLYYCSMHYYFLFSILDITRVDFNREGVQKEDEKIEIFV